jgi:peroxiredoxin
MRRSFRALLIALFLTGCADPAVEPPTGADASDASDAGPVAAPDSVPTAAALTAEEAVSLALGVGDEAPAFRLPDVGGAEVALADLLAAGPVVVTFYRGAWCPYCNTELRSLQAVLPQIEAEGARLVAISPQTPDGSLSMKEKQDLAFPVLSDVGNTIARQYGIVFAVGEEVAERYRMSGIDLEASNGDASYELPIPATYVIGTDGVIRYAFVEADYTVRAEPSAVLDALRAL